MSVKQKTKKPTLSKLKKKAWVLFSKCRRMEDCLRTTGSIEYGECFTCDFSGHISELDAGHFIPGRHNANLFSERGVHAQCRKCNRMNHGNQLEYRRQLIKLYGEGADIELENEAKQIKRFTISDLEALIIELRKKIKLLEV